MDGTTAMLVYEAGSAVASYFVVLTWTGSRVTNIRDFFHARYAIEGAAIATGS